MRTGPSNRGRRIAGGALAICALPLVGPLPSAAGAARLTYEKSWWSPKSSLWAAAADGSGARRLVQSRLPWVIGGPSRLSPDGRLVVLELTNLMRGGGRLIVMPATGGRSRLLSTGAFFAAWSPDSRTIAARRYERDGHVQLLAIDVRTGAARVLASLAGPLGGVSFSPGGETLVYAATGHSSGSDLYTVPAAGGRPTRLTYDRRSGDPLWGSRAIAFTRWRTIGRGARQTVRTRIWLLQQAGGAVRPLTAERAGGIELIAWSANGHRLLGELSGGAAATAFQYAVTVSALTGAVQPVGKPSAANGRHAVEAAALSRDGTTILGTQANGERSYGATDVVILPYHGGRQRVLVRHAIQPSWSR